MPTSFYVVVIFVFIVGCAFAARTFIRPAPLDIDLMIQALRMVENTPRGYVGRAGERSEWQIKAEVWRVHSTRPFEWASSSLPNAVAETKYVVRAHINWIVSRVESVGLRKDSYDVALVWTAGLTGAVNWGTPEKQAYATRAFNLYHELADKAQKQDAMQEFP